MKTNKKIWKKILVSGVFFLLLTGAIFSLGGASTVCAEDISASTVTNPTSPIFIPVANNNEVKCSFWHTPMNCMLLPVLRFMGFLLSLSATLFSWIILPENMMAVIDNPVIYAIWALIRDTLNIGFILVLLFSAFATIFRMSSYNYKNVLLNVVLMALLVNFSYPITRFIIDLSNSMMYYFVNAFSFGDLTSSPFAEMANLSGVAGIIGAGSPSSDTSYLLAAIIFIFILAVTLLVIAVLFVVRTVALATLVIFSSVAFIGTAIPAFSGKVSAWWDHLFKYAFFGPIMMFMLYIAMEMMRYINKIGMNNINQIAQGQSNDPSFIASMAFFSIPIVILWFGLGMAQSMSIAGASVVTGKGKSIISWPGRTSSRFAKWSGVTLAKKAERGIARNKYTWWMSPTAFKNAWKENTAEAERKAFKTSTGAWRDKLNYALSLGKEKTKFKDAGFQSNIADKQKELSDVSDNVDYLLSEFQTATEAKDKSKIAAILRIVWAQNDQNDLLDHFKIPINPENKKKFLYDTFKNAGIPEDQIMKQMGDIGEIAFSKGNFSDYGMTTFDKTLNNGKGGFRLTTTYIDKETGEEVNEQAIRSIGKATNLEPQDKMKRWHWNSIFTQLNEEVELPDGTKTNVGEIHDVGKKHLQSMTMLEVKQLNRARKDFINKLHTRLSEIQAFSDEIAKDDQQQANIINAFIKGIKEQKTGLDNQEKSENKDAPKQKAGFTK